MLDIEPINKNKFSDPDITLDNKPRAQVPFVKLDTLWINTGTLCNLTCKNCYIESSPTNDQLAYISLDEVKSYVDEIINDNLGTETIGFTGGEPFMNPDIIKSLDYCLSHGLECLVLTNAMQPLKKKQEELLELNIKYPGLLKLRVSLDHYTEQEHNFERGNRAWKFAMQGIAWLRDQSFNISIAGRSLTSETHEQINSGYQNLFDELKLSLNINDPEDLVVFPEMESQGDTPEITTECWSILKKKPTSLMCASSRMVVKHKGQVKPTVVACTLIPYEDEFSYSHTLKSSMQSIKLNHPHCSKFCVLGGGACS